MPFCILNRKRKNEKNEKTKKESKRGQWDISILPLEKKKNGEENARGKKGEVFAFPQNEKRKRETKRKPPPFSSRVFSVKIIFSGKFVVESGENFFSFFFLFFPFSLFPFSLFSKTFSHFPTAPFL